MFWTILSFVGLYFVYEYFRNYRKYELGSKIRGPRAIPILGNVLIYVGVKPEGVIGFTQDLARKYGKFFRVWVFSRLSIFSTDPKDIDVVLSSTKHLDKNDLYNFLLPWLGTGLLISSGQKWFTHRRVITPTFHFKILEQFVEIFDKHSRILIDQLQPIANGKSFNIYPYITLCALDIISESAMGTEVNAQLNKESEYVTAVSDISAILTTRFIKVWQRNDFLFSIFCSAKKRQDHAIKVMHAFTNSVIQKRRMALQQEMEVKNNDNQENDDNDVGLKKKMCFLDVLLQATIDGEPLSNTDIREEVDTFMFEGHDTTTSAVSFMLYCLSKNRDIQKKLYDEIIEEIGADQDVAVNYKTLNNLKYMDLVVKESLRMFPPVPIIGRRFTEEVNINGTLLPKGTNLSVGIFNMMRDPDFFPDPEKFDPERFSAENAARNPFSFIPFSAGARNCIGQKFALLEIKSTVSRILRNFEVLPGTEEPILLMNIVLKSTNGVHVALKKRHQ